MLIRQKPVLEFYLNPTATRYKRHIELPNNLGLLGIESNKSKQT